MTLTLHTEGGRQLEVDAVRNGVRLSIRLPVRIETDHVEVTLWPTQMRSLSRMLSDEVKEIESEQQS